MIMMMEYSRYSLLEYSVYGTLDGVLAPTLPSE